MKKLLSLSAVAVRAMSARDVCILVGLALTATSIAFVSPILAVVFVGVTLLYMGLSA